jgi:AcrR family transcriptional regulator
MSHEGVWDMAKTRESSEIVKSRILDVAAKLFSQHGVDSVSIRTIAAEAGINHSLVIRYFGSKDELVTAILRREISSLTGKYSAKPGQETSEGLENLRSIFLNYLSANQDTVKLIIRSGLDGLSPESYIDQNTERAANMLATWIESHQTEKELPDAKLVSIVVMGTLFSLVSIAPWLTTSVGFPPEGSDKRTEDIIDVLIWIVFKAIGLPSVIPQYDQNTETPDSKD